MSVSLIPESAPFNESQRAWLNGFLAGWTGLEPGSEGEGLAAATGLLESETDTVVEEDFPWHDSALEMDERLKLAEGKPVERRLMAAMAQLDCGACGYVCQTYSEAIAAGDESNLTLCSPGGKETAKMLKKIIKEAGAPSSNGQAATKEADGQISRSNPWAAPVKSVHNLNNEGSSKVTTHAVIDLAGSGLSYRVGDSLGVYPTNCPDLVDAILSAIGSDGSEAVEGPDGFQGTLKEALLTKSNLRDVEEELLELLIATTKDQAEKTKLQSLVDSDELDELDVLDLLEIAPSAKPPAAGFAMSLAALNPRLYSIASSLDAHPEEVHLTVGRATCEVKGRERKGVASTMFSDRINSGDKVPVFVQPSHGFTTPENPDATMIMVGPGTGIAPFRAFLEDRQAAGAKGKNWLFFGDQHAATDFLYEEEFAAMQESGLLTKLSTAFSRDQAEKVYVQNRMTEQGAELFEWLEEGAYFFVCGDAKRMANDVDKALHLLITEHGNLNETEAKQYVESLKSANRYVRDVY
ncbi:MAG: sulfite reductase subunit alpha [Lacipirellulaceae bacterium]